MRNALLFFVEQAIWTMSLLNRYRPTGFSQVNQYLTGVYYVTSQNAEPSPWYVLGGKAKDWSNFQAFVKGTLCRYRRELRDILPELFRESAVTR